MIASLVVCALGLAAQDSDGAQAEVKPLTVERLDGAAAAAGVDFSPAELEQMLGDVRRRLRDFEALRTVEQPNDWVPAVGFTPLQPGMELALHAGEARAPQAYPERQRPAETAELLSLSIAELGSLLRSEQLTCVELTQLYLGHLRELDEVLHCVVSFTEERALAQAAELDAEFAAGQDRGPLHGIPWGAKDLLSVEGTLTTWGAAPFREQSIESTASVVQRLDEAGAVLIAKLTLGALAMGDVWFGGTTRNPWNLEQGSSGSSAGPASAVVASGVAFAVGSETLGSIVSPSVRCGASSLRPTFGRVPRTGAMTLSWSMDKLGPMCRSAADAALVMAVLDGPDGEDPSVQDLPWAPQAPAALAGLRLGVLGGVRREGAYGMVLAQLEAEGAEVIEVELPDYPLRAMILTLMAEAATAFDEFTRSGLDGELVRQNAGAWPNSLRAARFIPAVEYLRAQRLRAHLCRDVESLMQDVDVLVHPPFAGGLLYATNLTGQPTFTAPVFTPGEQAPDAVCFTGRLFDDAYLLAVVEAWQQRSGHHLRHPQPLEPAPAGAKQKQEDQ